MNTAAIVHPKLVKASIESAIRPLLTAPENFEKFGVKFLAFTFPYIDVELDWYIHETKIRLRVDGTDFPYRPVGGWWIDSGGVPLLHGSMKVPSGNGFHITGLDGNRDCWFCFKGWREYHNHGSHQDISWVSIRKDSRYCILQLVMQLVRDLNNTGVTKA